MADKPGGKDRLGEFDIIARYFAPLAEKTPGAFGLVDDAALITPPKGSELVVTTDMLLGGVHFRLEDRPEDIAWKALAVNVSDLVAKGADPLIYLLALALPRSPDPVWLEGLASGLQAAQEVFGCLMAGGDTTSTAGPLTISITAIGSVPKGAMVRREGAKPGDALYVSGTIGDAALGLRLLTDGAADAAWGLDVAQAHALRQRYWQPTPHLALAPVLRKHACAAMDVSDGLAGDLRKFCAASGTGAELQASYVPLSPAARKALDADPNLIDTILTGGDDYEVLAAVPANRRGEFEAAARAAAVPVSQIGHMVETERGLTVLSAEGEPLRFSRDSYDHFW